jgi:hypothetical protein
MSHACFRAVRIFLLALTTTSLIAASGCTAFNGDWQKAVKQSIATNDLTGPWQGIWKSETSGHQNELRCLVTKQNDTHYLARFHAKYREGILTVTFGYPVPLSVVNSNGIFQFSGDADLGWLAGGLYHYAGHADATNYFSAYSCKYDHGTFQMNRP